MRHALSVLAFVTVALLVLAPTGAAVGSVATSGPAAPGAAATAAETPPAAPTLTFAVHLQSDGDARWEVVLRYPLNGSADSAAFRSLADDFESGGLENGLSADAFRTAASTASERVNRSMSIQSVARSADVVPANETETGTETENDPSANATGRLTLAFTWTNFANATEDRLVVGDAFAGGWFGSLGEDQTLLVYPPDGYRVQSVSPSTKFTDGALQWEGPRTFETGPEITLAADTGPSIPLVPIAGAVVAALVLGGLLVYFWYRPRRADQPSSAESPPAGESNGGEAVASPPDAPAESDGEDASEVDTDPDVDAGADTDVDEGAAAEVGTGGDGDSSVDEELLSDEERVERLLESRGGRMKQAKIVEETRWSNAKVSQLLSSMADEGRVEKLRIGRENLISLPDADTEESDEDR